MFTIVFARLIVRERDARQQLRRYAAEAEELATTRERNRIARDIHDSVGHYLTVVNVQIEAARATQLRPEHLDRAQELARQGLAELRRSVVDVAREPSSGRWSSRCASSPTDLVESMACAAAADARGRVHAVSRGAGGAHQRRAPRERDARDLHAALRATTRSR